jgi:hypothetical protein
MKNFLLFLSMLFILFSSIYSQELNNLAGFNRASVVKDTLMPYRNTGAAGNIGIRSVWVAEEDLDKDGKPEVIATDYSNNGRVHVMEVNGNNLEIVWSSPKVYTHNVGSGSTPRWVRTGDLDGDGKGEIIFPLNRGGGNYEVHVYEYNDADNQYQFAIALEAAAFQTQGTLAFRTAREVAEVYDFDSDGYDELIIQNLDNDVYVLSISGDIPGFGGWVIEGGDPSTVPVNGGNFVEGSHWHSVPADLNGDGIKEIVNHHFDWLGFWSIEPTGPNTYSYPDTGKGNYYAQFLRSRGTADGVAYMGIQPVDVDGDGDEEIAGIIQSSVRDIEYDPFLVNFNSGDDVLNGWDSTKFGLIGEDLWEYANPENPGNSFWGIGAADLNSNGKEEILLGGFYNYDVMSLEYKGTGSLLDAASYEAKVLYDGKDYDRKYVYSRLEIRDSAGVVDTLFVDPFWGTGGTEAPFVSKMYAGSDINGNNKKEVVISYQSVVDTTEYRYTHWDGSAFVRDSTIKFENLDQVTIRLLESTVTGIEVLPLGIVTPEDYSLEQNYPNPFNPTTSIRFSLPLQKKISIVVYDILGNEVKTLINDQEFEKGNYEVTWDGTNNFGNAVASGQYIYTMKYGNFNKYLKMTLLK